MHSASTVTLEYDFPASYDAFRIIFNKLSCLPRAIRLPKSSLLRSLDEMKGVVVFGRTQTWTGDPLDIVYSQDSSLLRIITISQRHTSTDLTAMVAQLSELPLDLNPRYSGRTHITLSECANATEERLS